MKQISLEYKKKVWNFLERMKPGQRLKVNDLATPETREDFIEAIKEFMASLPFNGHICFNHDYSEFYRTTPLFKNSYKHEKTTRING